MALELSPLAPEQISPIVARATSPQTPPPAKMMTAKGLAPMGPVDLVTALYQLSFEADPTIASAASGTAESLPDPILTAALGEALDERILDFFAQRVKTRNVLIEKILLNPKVHNETLVMLAGCLAERELEILAGNQQRMLSCPQIIEAMYFNRHARMSTIDRLLELAARHGLKLDGIPSFDELAQHILGTAPKENPVEEEQPPVETPQEQTGSVDDLFSAALNEAWDEGPVGNLEYETPEEQNDPKKVLIRDLSLSAKVRLANLGTAFHRKELIRDSNRLVAMAVIKSPAVTDQEVQHYAKDKNIMDEVIRFIAYKKEWIKNYSVKVALVNNPKCPLAQSMTLLKHLRNSDVRAVAKSKNVPAALAKAAKEFGKE